MKTTICIYCEDEQELITHLRVIVDQIKKAAKKGAIEKRIALTDSNCYGDHKAIIDPNK